MNRHRFALFFMLGVLLNPDQSCSALSQVRSEPIQTSSKLPISSNEALALSTLRHLAEAEYTFQSTIGRGKDFGSLQELGAAQLIDAKLEGGTTRGYGFKLTVTRATGARPSLFEVVARPLKFGATGVRSFHIDHRITIRDSYAKNARVSEMRPIVHECGSIDCAEMVAVWTMRFLSSAEATYQSTAGRGKLFGTLRQLGDNHVIDGALSEGVKDGYLFRVKTDAGSSTEAASFEVRGIPLEYGVTGRWSFYIDETYVLRGADKYGDEANSNDPEYARIK